MKWPRAGSSGKFLRVLPPKKQRPEVASLSSRSRKGGALSPAALVPKSPAACGSCSGDRPHWTGRLPRAPARRHGRQRRAPGAGGASAPRPSLPRSPLRLPAKGLEKATSPHSCPAVTPGPTLPPVGTAPPPTAAADARPPGPARPRAHSPLRSRWPPAPSWGLHQRRPRSRTGHQLQRRRGSHSGPPAPCIRRAPHRVPARARLPPRTRVAAAVDASGRPDFSPSSQQRGTPKTRPHSLPQLPSRSRLNPLPAPTRPTHAALATVASGPRVC